MGQVRLVAVQIRAPTEAQGAELQLRSCNLGYRLQATATAEDLGLTMMGNQFIIGERGGEKEGQEVIHYRREGGRERGTRGR